jgi:hypothetical protein
VPITQASHVTHLAALSCDDLRRSDYSGVTRKLKLDKVIWRNDLFSLRVDVCALSRRSRCVVAAVNYREDAGCNGPSVVRVGVGRPVGTATATSAHAIDPGRRKPVGFHAQFARVVLHGRA